MEIQAKMNDRKLEEMMGPGHSNLPRTISVGFIYIMDATGRHHELTMNMARSFDVRFFIVIYAAVDHTYHSLYQLCSNSTKPFESCSN